MNYHGSWQKAIRWDIHRRLYLYKLWLYSKYPDRHLILDYAAMCAMGEEPYNYLRSEYDE